MAYSRNIMRQLVRLKKKTKNRTITLCQNEVYMYQNFKIKYETIKVLREKINEYFYNLGVEKAFSSICYQIQKL